MPLICSRLGDHRDDTGGKLTVLRPEGAGFNAKLFHSVGVRRRVAVVTHAGDVVAAIQVESYSRTATIDGAVDLHILDVQPGGESGVAGGVRRGAVVIGHDSGREGDQCIGIAVNQGQIVDLVRLEGPAQYRVRRIDRRRSFRDGDGLRLRAHDEFDLNRQRLFHVESDILLHKAFKAGSRCLDGVPADGKVVDTILPITVYRRRPGETG